MILITAWCHSAVGVITRKLREIHFSLMMFHYGVFSTFVLSIWTLFEFAVFTQDSGLRLIQYSSDQYLLLFLTGFFNAISLNFLTLAFQNDKSAFIASIGYIMLVYAFLIDILYFKTQFDVFELLGAFIILAFNVLNIYNKIKMDD